MIVLYSKNMNSNTVKIGFNRNDINTHISQTDPIYVIIWHNMLVAPYLQYGVAININIIIDNIYNIQLNI